MDFIINNNVFFRSPSGLNCPSYRRSVFIRFHSILRRGFRQTRLSRIRVKRIYAESTFRNKAFAGTGCLRRRRRWLVRAGSCSGKGAWTRGLQLWRRPESWRASCPPDLADVWERRQRASRYPPWRSGRLRPVSRFLSQSIHFAIPKNTAKQRSTCTNVSASTCPKAAPTLLRFTVMALSTMI